MGWNAAPCGLECNPCRLECSQAVGEQYAKEKKNCHARLMPLRLCPYDCLAVTDLHFIVSTDLKYSWFRVGQQLFKTTDGVAQGSPARPGETPCGLECVPCGLECNPCGLECSPCALECDPCGLECNPCGLECSPCALECSPCGLECSPCQLECSPCGRECSPCVLEC